jgi:copper chaperone CopZ
MTHATLTIEGMTCEHCVKATRTALEELGAKPTRVEIGVAEANYDEAKIDERAFADAIEKAGYELKSFDA